MKRAILGLGLAAAMVALAAGRLWAPEGDKPVLSSVTVVPTEGGLMIRLRASDALEYHIGEESAERLVLVMPALALAGKAQRLPVNLANVTWVWTGEGELGVMVGVEFGGSVKVSRAMEGANQLNLIISAPPARAIPLTHAAIAQSSVIIDLHNDVASQIYDRHDLSLFDDNRLEASWPHLAQGGLKAAFFATWVPDQDGPGQEDAVIEIVYQLIYRHRDEMALALSYSDLERNLAAGKFSAFLAIEGGKAIKNDLNRLDYFHRRGVRYMTLVWNDADLICDASRDSKGAGGGLTPFGRQVVHRMNDLGMIIDVSHASDKAVDDVLAESADPIIASHSNCRALYPHVRNLDDNHIRKICGRGGVIGINFFTAFLTGGRPARVKDVANQFDHLIKVGGIDCAAMGSDFDGQIKTPVDLQNFGQLENLTNELIRRGYTEQDLKKIYGLNFIRVLKQVVDAKVH
jgi:membrane dipeptidase